MIKKAYTNQTRSASMGETSQQRGFVQNRLQNFGMTMIVMGASFGLYYLGLFGGISGPLQPERIGDWLASLGFTDRRLLVIFLSLLVIAIIWNWLYNAFNRLLGKHMTCNFRREGNSDLCAKPILKEKSDAATGRYVCTAGHHCSEAHIRVIKKGTVSHFFWMLWLVLSVMVLYLS